MGIKGDGRVRIGDGRKGYVSGGSIWVKDGAKGRVRVRVRIRVGRRMRLPSARGIALSALKEDLLQAAGKVSSNKRGDGEWATDRRASMEEALNRVSEGSRGARSPLITSGSVGRIE